MRRIKQLGICAVAVCALTATVVASAQAKTEHGALKFSEASGPAKIFMGSGVPFAIACSGSEVKGEVTSASGGTLTDKLTGCGVEGSVPAKNCGTAGTIESNLLSLGIGWISKARSEAGIDLRGAGAGETLFEFECGTEKERIKGSVIGLVTPLNVQNASGMSVAFKGTGPKQEPEQVGPITEAGTNPPGPGSLTQTLPIRPRGSCKGKKVCKLGQAEINTIASPGVPQFGRCVKAKGTGKFSEANCATTAEPGKGKFEFVPIPG